jgi:hypothetical protein
MKKYMSSIEKDEQCIQKLEFSKAYDKVNSEFLQQTLWMKGRFFGKWCRWINQFTTKGSVGIKINDRGLMRGWFPIFREVEVSRLIKISTLVKKAPSRMIKTL